MRSPHEEYLWNPSQTFNASFHCKLSLGIITEITFLTQNQANDEFLPSFEPANKTSTIKKCWENNKTFDMNTSENHFSHVVLYTLTFQVLYTFIYKGIYILVYFSFTVFPRSRPRHSFRKHKNIEIRKLKLLFSKSFELISKTDSNWSMTAM